MKKLLSILLFLPLFAKADDKSKYLPRFLEVTDTIHQIRITNLFGQIIYDEPYNRTNITVSLKDLPPGRYIIRINNTMYTQYSTDGKILFTTYVLNGGKL
jgi:hypothetical protein